MYEKFQILKHLAQELQIRRYELYWLAVRKVHSEYKDKFWMEPSVSIEGISAGDPEEEGSLQVVIPLAFRTGN